jgi:uncharacterized protein
MRRRIFRTGAPTIGFRARAGLVLCLLLALILPAYALTFPTLTGRVVDEAGILDATAKQTLDQKLAALETKTTNQLVVVTLRSLQGTSIEDFGYQLGRAWQIGQKDKNNGVVLIVAPNERKVRIEVGYGLEGELTDAVSRVIIDNAILPRFRANDIPGGIARGADDIIQVLSGGAEEFKQRAATRPESTTPVDIASFLFVAFIVLIMVWLISRSSTPGRGGRGGGPWIVPTGSSGGSSWSSGSSGGGFSGGGGSFGGGGSSGSW